MGTWPAYLAAASAAIILLLGLLHLFYTFVGSRLSPRDNELQQRMHEVSPRISRDTTMWKAWVGFNASHSFGAILFGLVYGYLALQHREFLFNSEFLVLLGGVFLLAYALVGRRYWFSVPFRGIVMATVLYAAAVAIEWH